MTHLLAYDDPEYADDRLIGSVIYNPVDPNRVCEYVATSFSEASSKLLDHTGNYLWADLDELDLTPVENGYVNTPSRSYYVRRIPQRHYRAGLTSNSLVSSGLNLSSFRKLFTKVRPSAHLCAEAILMGEAPRKAFSRWFCLQKPRNGDPYDQLRLLFKDMTVGYATYNSDCGKGNFFLMPEFQFLRESLEEDNALA